MAQLARDEMHGSNASDVMSVVTGATSTQDFVNSMQSRDALSRNEAECGFLRRDLTEHVEEPWRAAAIEKQIAVLKTRPDEKAASAQTAAETAQSERDALDKLHPGEGEARRDELSSMIDSLDSQSAKQATGC